MTFDRFDTLILRRFPRRLGEWSVFPIYDGECLEALNRMVHSGCVERKAKARWVERGREVQGYATLVGDWRLTILNEPRASFGLDPSEFKSTLIRSTELGRKLCPMLFDAESHVGPFQAIEYMKNMTVAGSVKLFHDDSLSAMATPHPFPVTASEPTVDLASYFNT